jgi:hypothetical protein
MNVKEKWWALDKQMLLLSWANATTLALYNAGNVLMEFDKPNHNGRFVKQNRLVICNSH